MWTSKSNLRSNPTVNKDRLKKGVALARRESVGSFSCNFLKETRWPKYFLKQSLIRVKLRVTLFTTLPRQERQAETTVLS